MKNRKKEISLDVVYSKQKLSEGFRKWILYSLLSLTRTQLLKMIDFPISKDSVVVDMGCNIGYVTRPLSLLAKGTIGMDIDRDKVRWAKKINKNIDFVCCDLCNLPLRERSIDMAVCASVFEHIENLEGSLEETSFVLKKRGKLLAGYPIETRLLEFIIKIFLKWESPVWQQRDIKKHTERSINPHIHKQVFSEIRKIIRKDFSLLKKRKFPNTFFPDLLSIYEIVLLVRNETRLS